MNSTHPKITVLMPVYNGEKYLREALESVLNQSFTNFEFLIIDDASTDNSLDIIKSYHDRRIRLIRNDTNIKLFATLNKGLNLSHGDYIARMDCDDISLPQRLSRQIEFMEENPQIGLLGAGYVVIDSFGKMLNSPTPFPQGHNHIKWTMCFSSPFVHPTIMVKKEIALKAGGYHSDILSEREIYSAEDYDLWRRMSKLTQMANLPDVVLYLRKHDSNLTKTHLTGHLINSAMVSRVMIADQVNENVSLDLVRKLKAGEFKNVDDVLHAGALIRKYYRAFIGRSKMPATDKKLISDDTANRLYCMALPFRKDLRIWGILLAAFRLRPHLVRQAVEDLKKSG